MRKLVTILPALLLCTLTAACGAVDAADLQNPSATQHAALAETDTCAAIEEELDAARDALADTEAWQKFTATPEFGAFIEVLHQLREAQCQPFDEAPSPKCGALRQALRAAWHIAQQTPAYDATASSPEYDRLSNAYRNKYENDCWPEQADGDDARYDVP